MKLMPNTSMSPISTITASSEMTNFPPAHLLVNNPAYIWKANTGITTANILIDLGSAKPINQIWLNNANFLTCVIKANTIDEWTSPSVNIAATLKTDDAEITKGFFDFSIRNYRYVRIEIPSQTLISGSELSLGNIILGESIEVVIAQWQPKLMDPKHIFEPDNGGYDETKKGKKKHVFAVNMSGTVAEILYSIPWDWPHALIYEDMGSVERSFLVFSPKSRDDKIASPLDMQSSFVLMELV